MRQNEVVESNLCMDAIGISLANWERKDHHLGTALVK
jgi:hypothetical protein